MVVGGVAGGASAAARARRLCEQCEIIVFERGPHVSFANCGLPYFVGGEIKEQDDLLLQTPESLRSRLNLDVRVQTEVTALNPSQRLKNPGRVKARAPPWPCSRAAVVCRQTPSFWAWVFGPTWIWRGVQAWRLGPREASE